MRLDAAMLVLVAATVTAAAEPAIPARKLSSEGYPEAARRDFVEGLIAERGGNVSGAMQKYASSSAKSPQANTFFNLARLELQLDRIRDARTHFARYLELAPAAADRATIAELVERLESADPLVTFGGRVDGHLDAEPAAVIVLDGVRIGASPVTTTVKPGRHDVERFTATTYDHTTYTARAGERHYVELRGRTQPGNVMLSGMPGARTWTEADVELASGKRFELPPGHYAIYGAKYGTSEPLTCTPIEFDVVAGKHITYVRIELAPQVDGAQCRKVRKTTTQKLVIGS